MTTVHPISTPAELRGPMPIGARRAFLVERAREQIRKILTGGEDRLLVIVGPCSVHDPNAMLEYAKRLAAAAEPLSADLSVVMRAYLKKPRTSFGWQGLVNDPYMDETHDVQSGLRLARQLLLDILDTDMPVACEFVNPAVTGYVDDLVSWGAIGARTVESQLHRQLVSGLSMPVGFKNTADGAIRPAVEGCRAAASRQVYVGSDECGRVVVVSTQGNRDGHIVLRGGRGGPNYRASDVRAALTLLEDAGMPRRLVIDASHANSGKDHERQAAAVRDIARQVAGGEVAIAGVMMESFLVAGRQLPGPAESLCYGQSVADACLGWEETERLLGELAAAVRERRR